MATITFADTGGAVRTGSTSVFSTAPYTRGTLAQASDTSVTYSNFGYTTLSGAGFVYEGETLVGGRIGGIAYTPVRDGVAVTATGLDMSVDQFRAFAAAGDDAGLRAALFGGDDLFAGGGNPERIEAQAGDDSVSGGGGNDTLDGGLGQDTLMAGDGNDVVYDPSGRNYLRGGLGDDLIQGGSDFDDAHGNEGNDTVAGGAGDDWTVGGKDDDVLNGEAGDDIVYGNLGNDTCWGGDGADIVRGGQGNDQVVGGQGDDWLSGDRGDDTVTGGAGADIFHTFGDAGLDRVGDFNAAEGDRVQLDPGTTYTVAQVGADTLVSLGGGGRMLLVDVQLSTLPAGWIFGA